MTETAVVILIGITAVVAVGFAWLDRGEDTRR